MFVIVPGFVKTPGLNLGPDRVRRVRDQIPPLGVGNVCQGRPFPDGSRDLSPTPYPSRLGPGRGPRTIPLPPEALPGDPRDRS